MKKTESFQKLSCRVFFFLLNARRVSPCLAPLLATVQHVHGGTSLPQSSRPRSPHGTRDHGRRAATCSRVSADSAVFSTRSVHILHTHAHTCLRARSTWGTLEPVRENWERRRMQRRGRSGLGVRLTSKLAYAVP